MCRWEGGGTRSLKGGTQGGRDPWGFGPGGPRSRRGGGSGEIPGTPGQMGTRCVDSLSPYPVSPRHITSVSWSVSSLSLLSRDRYEGGGGGHDVFIVCPRVPCIQDILQVLAGLF